MARASKANAVAVQNVQLPADIDAEMQAEVAAIADRIGQPGGNLIAVTQDKQFKLPDGTTSDEVYAVIVDFNSANMLYEGRYDPKNPAPPICFALGKVVKDLVPSEHSPQKQADRCQGCPMNEFGSDGNGKACKNQRQLILALPDNEDEDAPLYKMRVSPTAIKHFDSYVASVASKLQRPPVAVVTKIYFDPNNDYPSLRFAIDAPNPAMAAHFGRRAEAQALLNTEPDLSQVAASEAKPAKGRAAPARAAKARR